MKGIAKLILAGIGLVVFAGIAYKKYKEEEKKLEDEKKFIDEKLKEHGITQEDLDRVPEEEDGEVSEEQLDENNLVVMMYNVVENGSDDLDIKPWDRDFIRMRTKRDDYGNVECVGCLDCENIIHVKQSDIRGKEHLEFIFEIPSSAYDTSRFSSPKIRDYTNCFQEAAKLVNKEILRMEEIPILDEDGEVTDRVKLPFEHHIVGYYLLSYKIKGVEEIGKDGISRPKEFQKVIPIDKRDSDRYVSTLNKTEKLNNTEKYVKYLYKHIKDDSPIEVFKDGSVRVEFFSEEFEEYGKKDIYDLTIEFPFLMFTIAVPIAKDGEPGIDLEKALKCLRYFTEEMAVNGGNYNQFSELSAVRYDHVIFHAKDLDHTGKEGFDMLKYYTVSCEDMEEEAFRYRRLVVEPLKYVDRPIQKKRRKKTNN